MNGLDMTNGVYVNNTLVHQVLLTSRKCSSQLIAFGKKTMWDIWFM